MWDCSKLHLSKSDFSQRIGYLPSLCVIIVPHIPINVNIFLIIPLNQHMRHPSVTALTAVPPFFVTAGSIAFVPPQAADLTYSVTDIPLPADLASLGYGWVLGKGVNHALA